MGNDVMLLVVGDVLVGKSGPRQFE
jgi:hypothetical protein